MKSLAAWGQLVLNKTPLDAHELCWGATGAGRRGVTDAWADAMGLCGTSLGIFQPKGGFFYFSCGGEGIIEGFCSPASSEMGEKQII